MMLARKSIGKVLSRRFAQAKGGGAPAKKQSMTPEEAANKKELEALVKFYSTSEEIANLKLDLPEETKKRHFQVGREYNRQMTIMNNKFNKDSTDKIYLYQDALKALPDELREIALKTADDQAPPVDRKWPVFDTPPIPDFKPSLYEPKAKE